MPLNRLRQDPQTTLGLTVGDRRPGGERSMSRRAAPLLLIVGLGGCIDVPALSFQPLSDAAPASDATRSAAPDAAIPVDTAPPNDARPAAEDARAPSEDTRSDPADRVADVAVTVADTGVSGDAAGSKDARAPTLDLSLVADARGAPPVADARAVPPPPDAVPPDAAVPDAAAPPPIVVTPLPVPGPTVGRRFGAALALVPDQNGDGFADVVVGAPAVGPRAGQATSGLYLLDGVTGMELASYIERDAPTDFGSALIAGPFAANRPGWQVIVGARGSNNGRGGLFAHDLPGLWQVESVSGQEGGGHLGQTLAPAYDGGALLALAAVPGVQISPRIYFYELRFSGAQGWTLDAHTRALADVPIAGNYGVNLLALRPAQADTLDDVVVVGDAVIDPTRRVIRYRSDDVVGFIGEYTPGSPDETTGTSLLEIPSAPPTLAVGTPGHGRGSVSVFAREGGQVEHPLAELAPVGPAGLFGASLALAPLLAPADAATPVLCIGAPGDAQAPVGRVECRRVGAAENLIELVAPAGASAFGRTLAAATAPDADGSWLIVVGAPDTSDPNGISGQVVLHRVTTGP